MVTAGGRLPSSTIVMVMVMSWLLLATATAIACTSGVLAGTVAFLFPPKIEVGVTLITSSDRLMTTWIALSWWETFEKLNSNPRLGGKLLKS